MSSTILYRGYANFDISSLAGKTLHGAEFECYIYDFIENDHDIDIDIVEWTDPTTLSNTLDEWNAVGSTVFATHNTETVKTTGYKMVFRFNAAGLAWLQGLADASETNAAIALVDGTGGSGQGLFWIHSQDYATEAQRPILRVATGSSGVYVDDAEIEDVISKDVRMQDKKVARATVDLSNIGGTYVSGISLNDDIAIYMENELVFVGQIDEMPRPDKTRLRLMARDYGRFLEDDLVVPHSYEMEPGRTMTVADVLKGFPYQHGDGTMEESTAAGVGAAGWEIGGSASGELRITTSALAPRSGTSVWNIDTDTSTDGYVEKRIYVDATKYDKIKCSVWALCGASATSTLQVKSSSDAAWTEDDTTSTYAWDRLECEVDLASGDDYFLVRLNVDYDTSSMNGYFEEFTYCLHHVDDAEDVWDNGILADSELDTRDVACAVTLDYYETRNNQTRWNAILDLLKIVGEDNYIAYTSPYYKGISFRPSPTDTNSTKALEGANIISVSTEYGLDNVYNKVTVLASTSSSDWERIKVFANTLYAIHSPSDSEVLVGGDDHSNGVIYYSSDGGNTFTTKKSLNTGSDYVFRFSECNDTVYAATTGADGLLKSTDNGVTWSAENANIKLGSRVVMLTSAAGTSYLYCAGLDASDSDTPNVFRKELPSGSWASIYSPANTDYVYALCGHHGLLYVGCTGSAGNNSFVAKCEDPFVASPTFTGTYTGGAAESVLDGCIHNNIGMGTEDVFFTVNPSDGIVIRSQDLGETWKTVKTFDDANDDVVAQLAERDGFLYVTCVTDGSSKYGRVAVTEDSGETWADSYTGSGINYEVPQTGAIAIHGTTVYLSVDSNSPGNLYRRRDDYSIQYTSEDSTSQSSYGIRELNIYSEVNSEDSAKDLVDEYLATYKDPSVQITATIPLDVTLDVLEQTTYDGAMYFPLTFPIRFGTQTGFSGTYDTVSVRHTTPQNITRLLLNDAKPDLLKAFERLINTQTKRSRPLEYGIVTGEDEVWLQDSQTRLRHVSGPSGLSTGDKVVVARFGTRNAILAKLHNRT